MDIEGLGPGGRLRLCHCTPSLIYRIAARERCWRSTMSLTTAEAWGLAVVGILALVLALNQLGVDVPSAIGAAIRGGAGILNHPLLP